MSADYSRDSMEVGNKQGHASPARRRPGDQTPPRSARSQRHHALLEASPGLISPFDSSPASLNRSAGSSELDYSLSHSEGSGSFNRPHPTLDRSAVSTPSTSSLSGTPSRHKSRGDDALYDDSEFGSSRGRSPLSQPERVARNLDVELFAETSPSPASSERENSPDMMDSSFARASSRPESAPESVDAVDSPGRGGRFGDLYPEAKKTDTNSPTSTTRSPRSFLSSRPRRTNHPSLEPLEPTSPAAKPRPGPLQEFFDSQSPGGLLFSPDSDSKVYHKISLSAGADKQKEAPAGSTDSAARSSRPSDAADTGDHDDVDDRDGNNDRGDNIRSKIYDDSASPSPSRAARGPHCHSAASASSRRETAGQQDRSLSPPLSWSDPNASPGRRVGRNRFRTSGSASSSDVDSGTYGNSAATATGSQGELSISAPISRQRHWEVDDDDINDEPETEAVRGGRRADKPTYGSWRRAPAEDSSGKEDAVSALAGSGGADAKTGQEERAVAVDVDSDLASSGAGDGTTYDRRRWSPSHRCPLSPRTGPESPSNLSGSGLGASTASPSAYSRRRRSSPKASPRRESDRRVTLADTSRSPSPRRERDTDYSVGVADNMTDGSERTVDSQRSGVRGEGSTNHYRSTNVRVAATLAEADTAQRMAMRAKDELIDDLNNMVETLKNEVAARRSQCEQFEAALDRANDDKKRLQGMVEGYRTGKTLPSSAQMDMDDLTEVNSRLQDQVQMLESQLQVRRMAAIAIFLHLRGHPCSTNAMSCLAVA